jgi:hypothetical protein
MKQSIEEVAYDYATQKTKFRKEVLREVDADNYISRHSDCMEDFQCGYNCRKEESPWIKAKDQLPDVDENDISEQSEPVLVILSAKGHYEPEILVYNKYYHVWDTADADDYSCNISDDDLWMPIPKFNE